MSNKKEIDEDLLYLLYYDMKFTMQQIADMFRVHYRTIWLRMKKRGWKRRNYSEMQLGEKNPFYGKHHTEETKQKIAESQKNEKSHNWKGDNVKVVALHQWIAKNMI